MNQEVSEKTVVEQKFHIKILGRILELLGVQMYKRRDAAIAEIVANCWDAGADNVWIKIPDVEEYNKYTSEIVIEDDGIGMSKNDVQEKFLLIGRNRRSEDKSVFFKERRVMGRKGIGKLAGFGIANKIKVETWQNKETVEIILDLSMLNERPSDTEQPIKEIIGNIINDYPENILSQKDSGTRITLFSLKQETAIDLETLDSSLSRRFSRSVKGHMKIHINQEELKPFNLDLHEKSRGFESEMNEETVENGKTIKYNYVFTSKPIRLNEMRGWTILVNGKTAQRPNFFFDVDVKGSSQHSSKYLCGWIEADYLDDGTDDESDFVSTDRQEINWERAETRSLWNWGKAKTQEIFSEIATRNGEDNVNIITSDSSFSTRLDSLDPESKKKAVSFIQSIGKINVNRESSEDIEKIKYLADQIIKAFEYRHFIDVIDEIETACSDPEDLENLLDQLGKWEVLESRSILEIIKGRIKVLEKFNKMLFESAPETANRTYQADNMHDLIAGFPWLLNPEWQVFVEEKSISKLLKEKGITDFPDEMANKRIDFLALQGENTIAVIEIKSVDKVLELEELRKLEDYKTSLSKAHDKHMVAVLIYGGSKNIDKDTWTRYCKSPDFLILEWKQIFTKNINYYKHYRVVLENHVSHPDFINKLNEVRYTRKMINTDSVYRNPSQRKEGLGSQDLTERIN